MIKELRHILAAVVVLLGVGLIVDGIATGNRALRGRNGGTTDDCHKKPERTTPVRKLLINSCWQLKGMGSSSCRSSIRES